MTRPNEVEWTHVGRRNGRLRHQPASHSREPPDVVVPNPEPSLTCADIRTAHGTLRREWRDSDACALLRQLLSDEADSLPAVSKAVCLGIGSFDPANGSWRARRTAHFQLEAFLSMVESLRTSGSSGPSITPIIQEPAFTPADQQFCEELGLQVAEGSGAFSAIDSETMVFGIHLYLRTWHDALGHRPAMVVGTSLETWTSVQMPPAPLETGLLEPFIYMDASYRKEALPDLDQMFSNSCIYWRDRREGQRG